MHPSNFGPYLRQIGVFTRFLTTRSLCGHFNPLTHPYQSSILEIEVDTSVASIQRDVHPYQRVNAHYYAKKRPQQTALEPKGSPASRSLMINLYGQQPPAPRSTVGECLAREAAE
jgi:hypothetical protein